MSLNLNNNVINRFRACGILCDLIANRPDAAVQPTETMFYSLDEQKIYCTFEGAWILMASGGSGVTDLTTQGYYALKNKNGALANDAIFQLQTSEFPPATIGGDLEIGLTPFRPLSDRVSIQTGNTTGATASARLTIDKYEVQVNDSQATHNNLLTMFAVESTGFTIKGRMQAGNFAAGVHFNTQADGTVAKSILGDWLSNGNSSYLQVNDAIKRIFTSFGSDWGMSLDFTAAIVKLGDYAGLGNSTQVIIDDSGQSINFSKKILFTVDNVSDIGANGANRPRNLFVAGTGNFGSTLNVTSGSINGNAGGVSISVGGNGYNFAAGGFFICISSGVFKFTDSSNGDFGRLQLGGTTNAFPSIARSAATIEIKLADNSDYATLKAAKINIPTGANATAGTAILAAGTVTISTNKITAASLIFVVYDTPAGTLASGLSAPIGSIVAATSFVINSLTTAGVVNILDTSTVRWWFIN